MTRIQQNRQVVREVTTAVECDACHRRVDGADPPGWHYFSSSHNDWGNDSIDSHEEYDVCSWECFLKVVREVFDEYSGVLGTNQREATLEIDHHDWAFIKDMLDHQRAGDAA